MSERRSDNPIIRFFRSVFYIVTGLFAFVGIMTTVLTAILVYFLMSHADFVSPASRTLTVQEADKSIVSFKLDGPIVTRDVDPTQLVLAQLFGEPKGYQLTQIQTALRRAAEDIRVHGVFLDLTNVQGSFATFSELRKSLEEFRASEKPLYINLSEADSLSYFLASAGTKVNLSPIGGLMIPGPTFQLTYFSSALDKLGIDFEVFRAGSYKSAFEPFVLDQPSAPTLEMYSDLESSLRSEMVTAIAKGRQRSSEEVAGWLRRSVFTSAQAVQWGLVDRTGYTDSWIDAMKEDTKSNDTIPWRSYLASSGELDDPRIVGDTDSKLAYIEAVGEIRMTGSPADDSIITPDRLVRRLKWARERDDIKAVVMRIDSPGGSALASDLIWNEAKRLAEAKPLVISMGDVAASGGYYIAAPAWKILAEPSTITGSIGVIGAEVNGTEFPEKYGISFYMVTQSDREAYLNFGKAATEEDRKFMAESVEEVYQTFIAKVAEGRKKDLEEIDRIGQGRVYTGKTALDLGLVDQLGGREEAFKVAKELAKLDPNKLYPLAQYSGEPVSILDCFSRPQKALQCLQELEEGTLFSVKHWLPQILSKWEYKFLSPTKRILQLLENDHLLMYWPGEVQWRRRGGLD